MPALCRAYNPAMRCAPLLIPLALACAAAHAQSPVPASPPAALASPQPLQKEEQKMPNRDRTVAHQHVEDAAMSIDEVRYGGETQSITVTPKSGARPYQIVPSDGARNFPGALGAAAGPAGQRVWKLIDF
jgi:hypothetical protein